jgi:hypothetical protein
MEDVLGNLIVNFVGRLWMMGSSAIEAIDAIIRD